MGKSGISWRAQLIAGAAAGAILMSGGQALAQDNIRIELAPQSLASALYEFGRQTGHQVIFSPELTAAKTTNGVSAGGDEQVAMAQLLAGTGLAYRREGNTFLIVQGGSGDPQSGSAAGGGAEVEALIVTAQKREEDIQDVPIAISAFTQKDLEQQKIEGGFDLLKAIPNVTFSKNNFSSYNFSIRGIGTKAVSATTDPGVAVSFNNIALIQNRLFEQEYFDVERVEVLRGPQGTLYGRNATAGVINVISAKPDMDEFDGFIKGEVGNYDSKRISAMVNVPVIEDKLAIRLAGAITDRQGYDYNEVTKNAVNGRELWSARLTLSFNPTERIRSNLIWERFEEDDNRSRTGKQLCHRDPGPSMVGDTPILNTLYAQTNPAVSVLRPALFSQGCQPGSLYDDSAFGTPNGLALPFVFSMVALGDECSSFVPPPPNSGWTGICDQSLFRLGFDENGHQATLLGHADPYGGKMQSRDLRTIASFRDPVYRGKADLIELNVDVDLTEALTLFSQTAYNEDQVYSFQDFNRFNTDPIFRDTAQFKQFGQCEFISPPGYSIGYYNLNNCEASGPPSYWADLAPGGVFCDPQLGCSNTLAGFDISKAKARQFTQELRLQSDFEGPVNFSAGANYTRFDALVDYYVFYNLITAYALMPIFNGGPGKAANDLTKCTGNSWTGLNGLTVIDINDPLATCPYIDPNPIESIDGEGHNYFRSKNPYKLKSWAAFGEGYWQVRDDLKITAGLRYTDDRKTFIPVPTQILMAQGLLAGGAVNRGYPERPAIKQHWGEWTGRLGVDWKPDLSFTDETMLYAFYSRGYKGGGANPPGPGFATKEETIAQLRDVYGLDQGTIDFLQAPCCNALPVLELTGVEYEDTFKPEFVDAFEVGAKNTLLGGALTLNTNAFFYDYADYQVSQIRDRTAVNENFDAQVWGLEFQTMFSPSRNLQVIANLGYLDTKIADGMTSIDIMNRTQSNPNYILIKPWVQLPSNCVVPLAVAEHWVATVDGLYGYMGVCGGMRGVLSFFGAVPTPYDPNFDAPYDYHNYPELNGGAGLKDDLGGNELPNSPHWTANVGAQYGMDFLEDWRVTFRGDAYWQSQSWARVYNAVNDKLHGWYNVNLSVWIERPEDDLKIEFYVKNALDKTPITDAFLNSDDTALTTNVFVLDPRLIGLSVKKGF
jgi:iron complex outermembrane receptor protein